jgi:sugar fermentation stimulation protein A
VNFLYRCLKEARVDFAHPLQPALLIQRYKRFLADVQLPNGTLATAHCANPGAMLGLARPGACVWLSANTNPKAKLPYRWELEVVDGHLVGINTNLPNSLVSEALARNQLIPLAGYRSIRREVGYGNNSRIDFLLQHPQRAPCYVEVKNVHLKRGMRAEFPDCPTARGAKHLSEMMAMRAQGARCVMLYIVQRADVNAFSIAHDLDKNYAHLFTQALAQGVEAYAYSCEISVERVVLAHPLPLML